MAMHALTLETLDGGTRDEFDRSKLIPLHLDTVPRTLKCLMAYTYEPARSPVSTFLPLFCADDLACSPSIEQGMDRLLACQPLDLHTLDLFNIDAAMTLALVQKHGTGTLANAVGIVWQDNFVV